MLQTKLVRIRSGRKERWLTAFKSLLQMTGNTDTHPSASGPIESGRNCGRIYSFRVAATEKECDKWIRDIQLAVHYASNPSMASRIKVPPPLPRHK